ncbi:MAG: hypothetical protein QG656_1388, partial [Candidatus Hydrogenedentes bacterium]|nr:hypothetical protein [Candidatus Hydrogenedentota bacterium]
MTFPISRLQSHFAVLILAAFLTFGAAVAEDWPTYRHDNTRSGITAEALPPGLSPQWTFVPGLAPEVAWPDPGKEKPREMFDDAYHVAAVGGTVFFASSADNKVYALDAATGAVRWTAMTGGPVRCAPEVANGKVYVGSDDGYVYCLNAETGVEVWRVRGAFDDKKVVGNQKMISLWPVRTGVLIDQGVAYFGAGVFPSASTFVCAVNAEDGSLVWRNDTCGEQGAYMEFGGMTPQGYILASDSLVYVPSGRAMPGAFDRATGAFKYWCQPGGKIGGTWSLVTGDTLVAGMEGKRVYDEATGRPADAEFAWFPGYQLIVAEDYSYLLAYDELRALDRKAFAYAGQWRSSIITEREKLTRQMEKRRNDRAQVAEADRPAYDTESKEIEKRIDALNEQQKQVELGVHKWRKPLGNYHSMILAGETLILGSAGAVSMLNAVTGDELWTAAVEGRALGLAVANGRLFVSTDTGATYCFAPGGANAGTVAVPINSAPYPEDDKTALYASAADAIVQQTGASNGFCLVYGCGQGRLALELAKRTNLKVVGIDPDAENVRAARAALDAAGLGNRAVFDQGDLNAMPYANYFANLIVSDTMLTTGQPVGAAAELLRTLKPCGGMVCLGAPGIDAAALTAWLGEAANGTETQPVAAAQAGWTVFQRGALPGAGSWTHQYADTGNTACSDDVRVKGPLGILWFGEPGSLNMVERHARAAAPVSMDGRMIVQGENKIMAYDAYNGTLLWSQDVPGAVRVRVDSDMGNLALDAKALYVATRNQCLRLDPATGAIVRTYTVPVDPADQEPKRWGYLACSGNLLYGSVADPLRQDYGAFWDT